MMKLNEIVRSKWDEGLLFTNPTETLCFFPVSKNANSTLRNMFYTNKMCSYKNIDVSGMVKFTCVRDPLTRIVSSYLEINKLRKDSDPEYTKRLPFYKMTNQNRRFRQFICDINDNAYDTHILPQVYQMHDPSIMDYIILYDIFLKDVRSFTRKFKMDRRINYNIWINGAENKSLQRHLVNLVQSDKELQTKIIDMYSEDYQLYMEVKKEKMSI